MIPREVNDALGDYSDAWSNGDENIDIYCAALVAAIERAIDQALHDYRNMPSSDFIRRAEAAEAERDHAYAGWNTANKRLGEALDERDRLAAALATAQARIESARAYLGSAIVQLLPSDDQIIADHIRAAHNALSPATGTGALPATEKGQDRPASDTGTSGGGASPAVAPSGDYEAVCGATERPQP